MTFIPIWPQAGVACASLDCEYLTKLNEKDPILCKHDQRCRQRWVALPALGILPDARKRRLRSAQFSLSLSSYYSGNSDIH